MRRSIAAIASLALLGGCGGDSGGGAGSGSPKAVHIGLQVVRVRQVVAGHSAHLDGSIDDAGQHVVNIEADPYPFGSFRELARTKGSSGSFKIVVKPQVNTRYRASVADESVKGTSPPDTVYSVPKTHIRFARSKGQLEMIVAVKVARSAKPTLTPVFFYVRLRGDRYFTRLGSSRSYRSTKGRVGAVLGIEQTARAKEYFACVRGVWALGMGQPDRRRTSCGARKLNLIR